MSTACFTTKLLCHRPMRFARHFVISTKVNKNNNDGQDKPEMHFKDIRPMEQYKEQIKQEDPIDRTVKILKNDMKLLGFKVKKFMGFGDMSHEANFQTFPTHTDIVIIGGGAIGSAIAYFLKKRTPHGLNITVIERDTTYSECSTALSVGGLRQQFSLPENVSMSLFGAEFLRDVGKNLQVPGKSQPDVQFQPYGYLFLASDKGAEDLKKNSEMQCSMGARNVLLSPGKLKERFPWLNTDGVEVGCLGLEYEGWFDPWSLLNSLKQKSISYGVEYVRGNVVGFEFRDQHDIVAPSETGKYEQLERVILELPNGGVQAIKFGICIIAAGANSGEIAKFARIGEGSGMLSVPLPIEPRKRYVYCYHCPDGPGLDTPLVIDPEGAYFRREGLGGNYIGGMSPSTEEEPSTDNLDVDYEFFDKRVWPILANRVPSFEKLKVKGGWAGYYEYNTMDENGVIGAHPYYHNLMIASGFSGHGIQHAPAVGRAMMELILDGEFKTIDLSRFSFDRLCLGEPINEVNIV